MSTCHAMKLPRGIINSTGTACHLSSALLLLFHALVPIRESLIELSQLDDDDDDDKNFAVVLGLFFADYAGKRSINNNEIDGDDDDSVGGEEQAIDPTRLYKAIKKYTGIEAHNFGDAVTVMMKILSSLREDHNNNNSLFPLVHQLMTCALDSGRVRSKFVGERILHSSSQNSSSSSGRQDEHTNNHLMMMTQQRVKLSKERILPNPFTLNLALVKNDGNNNNHTYCLLEMLSNRVAPTLINGNYQWKEPFEETTTLVDKIDGSSELSRPHETVTKSLHIEALPPLWILHLDRFMMHHENGKTIKAHPSTSLIDIPEQFDVHETFDNLHGIYNLVGAILHVSQDADDDEEEEDAENGGHLVTLVKIQDCNSIYSYCLIDDADRTPIERDVAKDLLRGGSSFTFSSGDRGRCDMRGVLVVYERVYISDNTTNGDDEAIHDGDDSSLRLEQLQSQIRDQVLQTTMARQEAALAMVGRRLRVQWSKGKLYAGVVAAYDPATKKHTVQYDDGDVREYKLSRKTIEWL